MHACILCYIVCAVVSKCLAHTHIKLWQKINLSTHTLSILSSLNRIDVDFFFSRSLPCIHLYSKKDTDDASNPLNKVILVEDGSSTESSTKTTVRPAKQYGCNQCSYSADKKVSLNRHMRMHQTSPASSSVTSNGDDCSSQVKTIFYLQFSFALWHFVSLGCFLFSCYTFCTSILRVHTITLLEFNHTTISMNIINIDCVCERACIQENRKQFVSSRFVYSILHLSIVQIQQQLQPQQQQPPPQQQQPPQMPQQQQPSIQLHQVDRYCTDCDIRFSNTKTFRAHKEFYCGSRHRDGWVFIWSFVCVNQLSKIVCLCESWALNVRSYFLCLHEFFIVYIDLVRPQPPQKQLHQKPYNRKAPKRIPSFQNRLDRHSHFWRFQQHQSSSFHIRWFVARIYCPDHCKLTNYSSQHCTKLSSKLFKICIFLL